MASVTRIAGICLAGLVLVAPAAHAQALRKLFHREPHPKGYDAMTVHCESNGRWHLCPANVANGVRLVRQTSDEACIRRQSWGVQSTGIWVSSGCAGDFELSADAGDEPGSEKGEAARIIRCESRNGMRELCNVDTGQGVRLRRRLSNLPCDLGSTWGYGNDGIWVRRGCRADFDIDVPPAKVPIAIAPSFPKGASIVRCESQNGASRTCPASMHANAVLSNQRSHTQCVRDRNWWLTPEGIRVDAGCRGDFAVW